ncbi:MAG TPA: glycosyltransferase family 4 protein [Methanomassiliicoccales archaeon]|jgi:glycosyltransferase involved in cell wall biosynthesis
MSADILMLLSNEYRPDPRVRKEAMTLHDAGHRVTVLCWNRSHKVADHQDDSGMIIKRVRTGKVRGSLGLGLNMPLFFARAYLLSRSLKFDAVHCHDYDTLMLGAFICRLRHVPLVYDSHEWYSKMVEDDLPGFACKVIERTESLLLANCHAVIAANDAIADHLKASGAIDVTVVMNCIDLPPDAPRDAYREKDQISLFYGGSLEPGRFIGEMLEAVKGSKDCVLRIAGNGRLAEDVRRAAAESEKVQFLGYIPQEQVLLNVSRSDAVVCMMEPGNGNNIIGTPNKLFEAMAYGVPAIVTEGTHSGDLVKGLDCGVAVEYSTRGMSYAISALQDPEARRRMGRNGRVAAEKEYNWAAMKEKLMAVYRSL